MELNQRYQTPRRRVVITGMGSISGCGETLEDLLYAVQNGVSSARTITSFDTKGAPTNIAGELKDFDPEKYVTYKQNKRLCRSLVYGLASSRLAFEDAGLRDANYDPTRIGVVEATTVANVEPAIDFEAKFLKKGYMTFSPFNLINGYFGSGSGEIALEFGCKGPAITCSAGSASGNDIIGYGQDMITSGKADIMITGSAESPLNHQVWGTFCRSQIMTTRNETPKQAMRPFDENSDGFLLGEGGAFVVLEELTHALCRGARIYAEVLAQERACEAFHATHPEPTGAGLIATMEKSLRHADLIADDIDYINAHGTANRISDIVEAKAIRSIFSDHGLTPAVSSTKPITGHLLAAAGAIETIICAQALYHQVIPPTLNLETPSDGCEGIDFVPNRSRPYPLRTAMSLSTGFGGRNSCMIMRRYSP